jgi:hypothetical protein
MKMPVCGHLEKERVSTVKVVEADVFIVGDGECHSVCARVRVIILGPSNINFMCCDSVDGDGLDLKAIDKTLVNPQDGEDFGCFDVVMWKSGEGPL